MKKIIMVVFLILIICFPVFSAKNSKQDRYIYICDDSDNKHSFYFDSKTIKYYKHPETKELLIDVWIKSVYLKKDILGEIKSLRKYYYQDANAAFDAIEKYIKISHSLDRNVITLDGKGYFTYSTIDYDKNGNAIDSWTFPSTPGKLLPDFIFVTPDTIGESFTQAAVRYAKLNDRLLKERMNQEE